MVTTNPNSTQAFFKSIFCYFYVYFRTCSFGKSCKFIHPEDEQFDRKEIIQSFYASDNKKIPCKFFHFGICKYGESCWFNHSEPIYVPNPWYHINTLGLPKRWGEPVCAYYMWMGFCGYGLACKFHHPEPVWYDPCQEYGLYADSEAIFREPTQEYDSYVGEEAAGYQYGYLGINDGWNGELFGYREPCTILNNVGLPLRPGKRACRFYMNFNRCKYGQWCKFDHPQKWSLNEEGSSSHTHE